MNNFTKEIKLAPEWEKKYFYSRIFVYVLFLAAVFSLAYVLIFPSAPFVFSFRNPDSSKNTIVNPRDSREESIKNGKIGAGEKFLFNANLDGNYSKVKIVFSLENNSGKPASGAFSVRKSFRSFFYPIGKPMGFPDGSLVKNNNNFYIVSQNKLRMFSNLKVMNDLGFRPENFVAVSDEEIGFNEKGGAVDSKIYPDDSIFKIDGSYYQLEDRQLAEFVSVNAYLSKYNAAQAIEKDGSFLDNYQISQNQIGFSDGTFISFGNGVFVVSGNKIYPIDNSLTFTSMNFSWKDVLPASGEEVSIYQREKLFTLNNPQPNGIIFSNSDKTRYYIVENGTRRELSGTEILAAYSNNKTPIAADEKGLTTLDGCEIEKTKIPFLNQYQCEIDLAQFQNLPGDDYEFSAIFDPNIQLKNINATFETSANYGNLRYSISTIKNRVIANYVGQPQ